MQSVEYFDRTLFRLLIGVDLLLFCFLSSFNYNLLNHLNVLDNKKLDDIMGIMRYQADRRSFLDLKKLFKQLLDKEKYNYFDHWLIHLASFKQNL